MYTYRERLSTCKFSSIFYVRERDWLSFSLSRSGAQVVDGWPCADATAAWLSPVSLEAALRCVKYAIDALEFFAHEIVRIYGE